MTTIYNLLVQNTTAGSYYSSIQALTAKDVQATTQNGGANVAPDLSFLFSPYILYACLAIFFTLFIGALVVQIKNHVLDWKRAATSLTVALLLALTPLTIRSLLQTTVLQSQASPDEVPKNVTVYQITANTVQISYETDAQKTGAVRYGLAPLSESQSLTAVADSGAKRQKHLVILNNIRPAVVYEYEILSGSKWYTNKGKSMQFIISE